MSLFARLFKYRPSEGRSPQEDFLTEALAGVLESSFPLRAAFVNWLVECDLDFERVCVETQKSVGGSGRLDLWIEAREQSGERHAIVFENKIEAPEGEGQLRSYERYLRERPEKRERRTLIYLTPHTRSDFSPADDSLVTFRPLRWFEVFHWFKTWTQETESEARPLVGELLALMKEWNLTIELSKGELADTVEKRPSVRRVEQRMLQLLREIRATCISRLDKISGKRWTYDDRELRIASPYIDESSGLYFSFGFDFDREDDDWNVTDQQLPSAFFAVWANKTEQLDQYAPSDWGERPRHWDRNRGEVVKVRQLNLNCLTTREDSLHEAYLDFFKEALSEALSAANIG